MQTMRNVLVRVLLCVAAAATSGLPVDCQAGPMMSLVPAYFYPGTGGPGGSGDGWAAMAAAAGQVPVTAIFNPNSGPGTSVDPNYVTAINNLEAAGGSVVAYVYTDYTNRSLTAVEADLNTYISQYGSSIRGFFVDQMTNNTNAGNVAYYHSLYDYIKGLNSSYQVIGNPGTSTVPDYLASATKGADVLVTYENNNATNPYTLSTQPGWVNSFPASDFANIIYNQANAADMLTDVDFAAHHNVGSVFVTDASGANPYDQLPSYWDQEVAAIKAAPTPEPGMLTLWTSWLLAMGAVFAAKAGRRSVGGFLRSPLGFFGGGQ